jgi:hypothetical protein
MIVEVRRKNGDFLGFSTYQKSLKTDPFSEGIMQKNQKLALW